MRHPGEHRVEIVKGTDLARRIAADLELDPQAVYLALRRVDGGSYLRHGIDAPDLYQSVLDSVSIAVTGWARLPAERTTDAPRWDVFVPERGKGRR